MSYNEMNYASSMEEEDHQITWTGCEEEELEEEETEEEE